MVKIMAPNPIVMEDLGVKAPILVQHPSSVQFDSFEHLQVDLKLRRIPLESDTVSIRRLIGVKKAVSG